MSRRRRIRAIDIQHSVDERGPVVIVRRGTQKHRRREYHNLTAETRKRLERVIDGADGRQDLTVISLLFEDELWIGVVRI
jgi:predicted aminopeptidase